MRLATSTSPYAILNPPKIGGEESLAECHRLDGLPFCALEVEREIERLVPQP